MVCSPGSSGVSASGRGVGSGASNSKRSVSESAMLPTGAMYCQRPASTEYCACVTGASSAESRWAGDTAGRLAFAAHVRDQDDLHHDAVTHPGGVIWSAVTACALEQGASWGEAAAAAALGYELVVRLAVEALEEMAMYGKVQLVVSGGIRRCPSSLAK